MRVKTQRDDPQRKVRIPPDLNDWVKEESARNGRSINAEVVILLREAQEKRVNSESVST